MIFLPMCLSLKATCSVFSVLFWQSRTFFFFFYSKSGLSQSKGATIFLLSNGLAILGYVVKLIFCLAGKVVMKIFISLFCSLFPATQRFKDMHPKYHWSHATSWLFNGL